MQGQGDWGLQGGSYSQPERMDFHEGINVPSGSQSTVQPLGGPFHAVFQEANMKAMSPALGEGWGTGVNAFMGQEIVSKSHGDHENARNTSYLPNFDVSDSLKMGHYGTMEANPNLEDFQTPEGLIRHAQFAGFEMPWDARF